MPMPTLEAVDAPRPADEDRYRRVLEEGRILFFPSTPFSLPDEDRAVIRMLYYEGMSIADTARGLQIEQKRLYPRIKLLLSSLRKTLKSERISADILEDLDST